MLNLAQHVIFNAARLWTEFLSDQKQRLQKVLFPKSVTFVDGIYKTTETRSIFKLSQESGVEKQVWRPYRDSNPGSHRERVVS